MADFGSFHSCFCRKHACHGGIDFGLPGRMLGGIVGEGPPIGFGLVIGDEVRIVRADFIFENTPYARVWL